MSQALRSEYERRVAGEAAISGNKVPVFQRKFGAPDGKLLFLKTKGDMKIYRGLMGVCGVGVAITGVCLYLMATGNMPKKERPS